MTANTKIVLEDAAAAIADAVNERSELTQALKDLEGLEACETAPNAMDMKIEELHLAICEQQDIIREKVREMAHLLDRTDILVGLGA